MKRTVSFVICFALAILTAMSFAGCKKENEEKVTAKEAEAPSIIGKWDATVDITGSLKACLDVVNPSVAQYLEIGEIKSKITLTFSDDGKYSITVNDKDVLEKKFKELEGGVSDALHKFLEKVIEAHGLNTTPEGMCLEQDGMTFEEEVADFVKKWDLSKFSTDSKGVYKLDENTLHLGNETNIIEDKFFTIDLKTKTLTVKYYSQDSFGSYKINDLVPIEFKKAK